MAQIQEKNSNILDMLEVLVAQQTADFINSIEGCNGWNALHAACINETPDTIKILLLRGANPNSVTANGLTPCMISASRGSVACLNALYEGSISNWSLNVNATPSIHGPTALDIAVGEETIIYLRSRLGGLSSAEVRSLPDPLPKKRPKNAAKLGLSSKRPDKPVKAGITKSKSTTDTHLRGKHKKIDVILYRTFGKIKYRKFIEKDPRLWTRITIPIMISKRVLKRKKQKLYYTAHNTKTPRRYKNARPCPRRHSRQFYGAKYK